MKFIFYFPERYRKGIRSARGLGLRSGSVVRVDGLPYTPDWELVGHELAELELRDREKRRASNCDLK